MIEINRFFFCCVFSFLIIILWSRYGFYGQPFDCELFDMEAPHSLKQISPSPATTYASIITNSNNNIPPPPSFGQEELDFYDVIIPPTDKLNSKPQTEYARNSILGLLEVEPLHFSCHSTSDGTKMERMDIGVAGPPVLTAGTSGLSGTINFGELPMPPPVDHPHHITNKQINKIQQFTHNKVREQIQKMFGDSAKIVSMKNANNAFELMPPTPKTTPLFMTPPVTPPNESLMNQLSQIPDVFSVEEELGPSTLKASVSKVNAIHAFCTRFFCCQLVDKHCTTAHSFLSLFKPTFCCPQPFVAIDILEILN